MNSLYRTVICALATVTWLSFTSCARHSTAANALTAQSDNLIASPTSSPPSLASAADSKVSIAQNSVNSRPPHEKLQQSKGTSPIVTTADIPGFNSPIFKPTYLPAGFYLREFQAMETYYIDDPTPFDYSIIYQERDQFTCLEIYSVLDGTSFGDIGLSETSVKVGQGNVTVYSGNVEGRPMIVAQVDGEQIGLPSNYYFTLASGYDQYCQPVSLDEFIQVLQSMRLLK